MHTTEELSVEAFEYRRGDEPVSRGAVMPVIDLDDRLGVVMADPSDGLGAGNFVLSCVTTFYRRLGEEREAFFEYPDYYTFQASADPLDYLEFDIWPDHKNVSVTPDPERVLRAINDRAVTVLLVPDGPGSTPEFDDATLRSAERRIDACFRYSPDGRLEDAEFSIRVPRELVREWYRETVDAAGTEPTSYTPADSDATHVVQQFRRIGLDEALGYLPAAR